MSGTRESYFLVLGEGEKVPVDDGTGKGGLKEEGRGRPRIERGKAKQRKEFPFFGRGGTREDEAEMRVLQEGGKDCNLSPFRSAQRKGRRRVRNFLQSWSGTEKKNL